MNEFEGLKKSGTNDTRLECEKDRTESIIVKRREYEYDVWCFRERCDLRRSTTCTIRYRVSNLQSFIFL
ncbi:uncharacterized protein G2W53_038842 [Senna tora]|uniref:Uncharacterized protein n=1 Tax=Senna tora TaxID=362788 RepID=A0A834SP10_9FABA|nr:uncharacterized protein G2W53_038842 [Senna tora]